MAFAIRNLSVLAYAQGFTLWHYKAGTDRLDDVAEPGFLADAGDILVTGDMLLISAADGGRIAFIRPSNGAPALAPLA
jgi:hypothetical protein